MSRLLSLLLLITSFISIGYITYNIGYKSVPKNCSELGVVYLEIGKKALNISDFSSRAWVSLVDAETDLVNNCNNSLRKLNEAK
jgi:hypothetical protein